MNMHKNISNALLSLSTYFAQVGGAKKGHCHSVTDARYMRSIKSGYGMLLSTGIIVENLLVYTVII